MPANSAAASGLATRYAMAVFDLAKEHGELDAVAGDLSALRTMFQESPDLQRLAGNPSLSRADEEKGIAAVADAAGFSPLTKKFLGVLAEHRRLAALDVVVEAFQDRLAAERGEVVAEVTSAAKLGDDEIATLKDGLARMAGKNVNMNVAVDPSLLGGLVVRVGSRMIDASLRSKLKGLELSMRGVG